ncbi:MAG: MBL fold metallo-hydrolase, partial [Chloroflexota bacterium]
TFLGTGGSEGYPALFCHCVRCRAARSLGGKNIRRRSSLLVNHDLLLDLGPDVPAACQQLGLGLDRLEHLLVTHLHDDHFLPVTLKYRQRRYVAGEMPDLRLYGSAPTLERVAALAPAPQELRLSPVEATPGVWLDAGPYRVLPLAANHAARIRPLVYAVFKGGQGFLYATDTGAFPEETWQALAPLRLSLAVLDVCFWDAASADSKHLTVDGATEHAARLRAMGVLEPGSPILATHISHRGQPDHGTLAARLWEGGIEPAYDGLNLHLRDRPT